MLNLPELYSSEESNQADMLCKLRKEKFCPKLNYIRIEGERKRQEELISQQLCTETNKRPHKNVNIMAEWKKKTCFSP